MLIKFDHCPNLWGKNHKWWKPPPSLVFQNSNRQSCESNNLSCRTLIILRDLFVKPLRSKQKPFLGQPSPQVKLPASWKITRLSIRINSSVGDFPPRNAGFPQGNVDFYPSGQPIYLSRNLPEEACVPKTAHSTWDRFC